MWTYSGNPSSSAKDQVRFLIGDTEFKSPLLLDEEINYILNIYNQFPMNAAIRACETVIAKFSRMADETAGQVSISFSQRAKAYRSLLSDLRSRLSMEDMSPVAGGISISDKQATVANADRVPPFFTRTMMENRDIAPWVTSPMDIFGYPTSPE